MATVRIPNPEDDKVEIVVERTGVSLDTWADYAINSDFFTPTDGWSFTLGDGRAETIPQFIVAGDKIQIFVNGLPQCTGYVDSVDPHAEKGGGSTWTVQGRDLLAQAVDGCIDPRNQFKPSMTLGDVVDKALGPFFEGIIFTTDNAENVNVMTGQTKGKKYSKTTTTKRGKQRGGKVLKGYDVDMLKPHPSEGAFAFAQRIANRHGLWIWLAGDGQSVIVGHPRIEPGQCEVLLSLTRTVANSQQNNIVSGGTKVDLTDQPSCIIADAASGGGTFGRSKTIARMVNPLTGYDIDGNLQPSVAKVFENYTAGVTEVEHEGYPVLRNFTPIGIARPLWLHDEESHTIEELEGFIRREMSTRLRKAVVGRYRVEGHGQIVDGAFVPWAIDSQVHVKDDQSGVDEVMWIQARTFHRGRTGGTYTDLTLIRLSSLEF